MKAKIILIIAIAYSSLIVECNHERKYTNYDVKADIRLANKFYSLYIDKSGQAHVVRGEGSFYLDTLKVNS